MKYLRMKKVARIGEISVYKDVMSDYFECVYPDGAKIAIDGWTFAEVLDWAIRMSENEK